MALTKKQEWKLGIYNVALVKFPCNGDDGQNLLGSSGCNALFWICQDNHLTKGDICNLLGESILGYLYSAHTKWI